MTNPADGAALQLFRGLSERIASLENQAAQYRQGVSFELARVIVYSAGTTCKVQYPNYPAGEMPWSGTLTGPTRILPFHYGTSPIVGSNVLILNSPAWSGVIMPISAF